MEWLIAWWDGLELWLVQLPYPLLVTLMLVVLLPLCWGVARVLDRGIDEVSARVTRVRGAQPPPGRQDPPGERRDPHETTARDHGA
ncbi:hypothetical protein DFQ14_110148 [Halopolyspora algeriensis]|uniref:Uncharacterized protein n=1 Tax=Halopolyspora algeriensis TaxID=1500506 RepID=A0A368VHF2_9ACTN|nr:hypothetical protein [Halopolyspora algeriensis]RCW40819.1 hypothetical protein DFQ14_110148 [Halopolyspora algeriensis]TQM53264.1 hypothetical protein FHU43_2650 [Halopolyspora algeriensis]